MTKSIAKVGKEDAYMEGCKEEDTIERTKSDDKHIASPIHQPASKVHNYLWITPIQWIMSTRIVIFSHGMTNNSQFLQ